MRPPPLPAKSRPASTHWRPWEWLGWLLLLGGGVRLATALGIHLPLCRLRETTGLPCPFCGGSRAAGAMLSGEFTHALALNPLAAVLLVAFVVLWISQIVRPGVGIQMFNGVARALQTPRGRWLLGVVLALNWAYVVWALPR